MFDIHDSQSNICAVHHWMIKYHNSSVSSIIIHAHHCRLIHSLFMPLQDLDDHFNYIIEILHWPWVAIVCCGLWPQLFEVLFLVTLYKISPLHIFILHDLSSIIYFSFPNERFILFMRYNSIC